MRIDQYQGADAVGLEEKIKQHLENDPGSNEDTDIPKGYVCRLTSEIIDIPSICHYLVKVKLTMFSCLSFTCLKYFKIRTLKVNSLADYWDLSICVL